MDVTILRAKYAQVRAGMAVVMSDAEIDWLIDNDEYAADVVSIRNPHQLGTLDVYLVGKVDHPVMRAERAKMDVLTSAQRSSIYVQQTVWDEPVNAASPRGWYWPKGSTSHGQTPCAGHYLDYGPDHYRYDGRQLSEPGSIHCVVIAKDKGDVVSWRYVETVEAARAWIEAEAAKFGHTQN